MGAPAAPARFRCGRCDHNSFLGQSRVQEATRELGVQQGDAPDDAQRLQNHLLGTTERLRAALPSSSFQGAITGETRKRFIGSKQT